tara:strand:+ start:331261 stop:331965 length:705 start_codon:yes stop_codon:yes gene_type:complete
MKKILCLSVLALCLSNAQATNKAKFLDPAQINLQQILSAPAAPDSATSKDELAILHQIQSSRSKAQVSKAQSDETLKNIFLYQNVLGEKFNSANFPITSKFSKHIKKDVHLATQSAKLSFHRIRPYNLDKTLAPVCETKTVDNSYPSQHSTLAWVYASVLIEMVPQNRDAILARAEDYAHNRLVCGAHFPSDVIAGRRLAEAIFHAMYASPAFQQELKKARNEIRAFYMQPAQP